MSVPEPPTTYALRYRSVLFGTPVPITLQNAFLRCSIACIFISAAREKFLRLHNDSLARSYSIPRTVSPSSISETGLCSYARHLDRISAETTNLRTLSLRCVSGDCDSHSVYTQERDAWNLKRIGAITTCASCNGTSARLTGQSYTPFRESRKTYSRYVCLRAFSSSTSFFYTKSRNHPQRFAATE